MIMIMIIAVVIVIAIEVVIVIISAIFIGDNTIKKIFLALNENEINIKIST